MEQPHVFKVNLETTASSLEQTTPLDFDPLYKIASNPVVWEQHPEKDRWKRPGFLALFQGAMENDLGYFTILDKIAGAARCASDDEKVVYGLTKDAFNDRAWGVRRADQN